MRTSHLRSPYLKKSKKDGQGGLPVRSYFKQQITEFPNLNNPEVITHLDLSFTQITNFEGMPYMPNLVKMNLASSKINSFIGAVNLPKLEQLEFAGAPITQFEYLHVMCLIAFGMNLKLINHVRVTKQDIKLAELYMSTIEPMLRTGWLIASISPDIVVYEVSTKKRKRIFMNNEVPIELPTPVMKTPNRKTGTRRLGSSFKCLPGRSPVKGPQSDLTVRVVKHFEAEEYDQTDKLEQNPVKINYSIEPKPEAKSAISKLQAEIEKKIMKLDAPKTETKPEIKKDENQPEVKKSEKKPRASGIPVRSSIMKSRKENEIPNNSIVIDEKSPKVHRSSKLETPRGKELRVALIETPQEVKDIPKPEFGEQVDFIEKRDALLMDDDDEAPVPEPPKPVLSIHTTTTPIKNRKRSSIVGNELQNIPKKLIKLEMGKSIEYTAVTNEIPQPMKKDENVNTNSLLSPLSKMSTTQMTFSDDESLIDLAEFASPSKLKWPKRRKARRSIVKGNFLNKSDGSFDVCDLGLPAFDIVI